MRYLKYSEYLKEIFGEKVYKIPIHLVTSCPNRDGNISTGGCTFCGEVAAGFELLDASMEVNEQIQRNKAYIGKKYGAKKFIAYFQNFTNTYMPHERFMAHMRGIVDEDIVSISISTRPDAVDDQLLDALKELEIDISFELGLQSINLRTLKAINRGHSLAEFIDAHLRIKKRGFRVAVHMILNLPTDEEDDIIEASKVLSALGVDEVKLHSLYILKGTEMGRQFIEQEFQIISVHEYVERVILFLRYLSPDIAVQRLLARAPESETLFCNWGMSWWRIRDMIEETMEQRDVRQGDLCDYLNGKALRKYR
jgi:radical SAM protein (TIGR01212 family)